MSGPSCFSCSSWATQGGLRELGTALQPARSLALLFLSATPADVQLAHGRLGGQPGPYHRDQPGILSRAAGERRRRALHPPGTLASPAQWAAIAIAAIGVGSMVIKPGAPWIALVIAPEPGARTGCCESAPASGAIPGLAVETLILSPLAVGYLLWQHHRERRLGTRRCPDPCPDPERGHRHGRPPLLFAYAARSSGCPRSDCCNTWPLRCSWPLESGFTTNPSPIPG